MPRVTPIVCLLVASSALAAVGNPAGSVPAGMPARLAVGLNEDSGRTWMRNSGVKWDARYRYLVKGWVNNWGWGPADGSYALNYLRECQSQGTLPVIEYYQHNNEPGGGESAFLSKAQNATTMRSYFSDFKLLMQRAKDFGAPVLVLIEADGTGLLEQATRDDPNVYAAVAATGLPELSGQPNTVAGWGKAFVRLRDAVGAGNVMLGMHVSGWATGQELFNWSATVQLQPHVDKAYAFLSALGLSQYDVLVADPLDRDADYFRLMRGGENRWWDTSDAASILSASFNRYAEWLRLWNLKAGKRWVLWQIPEGNSGQSNVCRSSAQRSGYKDNRSEYLFGPAGAAHREKFATSGVAMLLFGPGDTCQASHETDGDYLKANAGAFLNAGGLAIPRGAGSGGTVDAGTPVVDAGTPVVDAGTPVVDAGTPPPSGDLARYNFESSTQGWNGSTSSLRAYAGARSLAVSLTSNQQTAAVVSPPIGPGRKVTFHLWIPSDASFTSVQPYVLESNTWRWTGTWTPGSALVRGAWNTLSVTVPLNAQPLYQLGIELTPGTWRGTVYVDSVSD